ncbi:tetratricopeptide repeat domain protein [Coleofasciculus chthonoplastes PCC 7420]|uniref:Tetratricopeptide repeat domain protein n=1 Tax=Coleofasciculus chthonoplastes PCC 7420 TaxID=118168 RepID=B4VNN6_9CYAN|nr:CHAT domain-containing protein [Coleofasciculus chthonoplastes]EDX76373.1 tetratricopeptide repeat domain protein [Coleofasciculus chthonoplastes PCC 7420]
MKRLRRSSKKQLFFWGLVLVTCFVVVTVRPVAAQYSSNRFLTSPPTPLLQGEGRQIDTSNLVSQGKINEESGHLADTIKTWQEAVKDYEKAGDRMNQALALHYLSLAYQDGGQWQQAEAAIKQSLDLLQPQANPAILAPILNTKGSLQLAMGQPQAALDTWKQAETVYAQADDQMGVLGSKINQAQAWQSLGMVQRSRQLLESVQPQLTTQPDSIMKATGLRSLGRVWEAIGDLPAAQTILQESLAVAQRLNSAPDISAALLSLGNISRNFAEMPAALAYYQQAAEIATTPLSQVQAKLNQLKLLIHLEQFTDAQELVPQIQRNLSQLSPSRETIYAQVNYAERLIELVETADLHPQEINYKTIAQQLADTLKAAKRLNDKRAESLSLGILGKVYDKTQQWSQAQDLTEQALFLSQSINAADLSYQWDWQLAQILTKVGDKKSAIAANKQAFDTVQSLRGDLVAMNADVRFSFQEEIEPIYRHLVSLLLDSPSPEHLQQARTVIESLQLAELENFFRTACLETQAEQIDTVIEKGDTKAAVIYPIILPNRLAVILSLPGHPLQTYHTNVSSPDIEATISRLRQTMNPALSNKERLKLSQTVYDWLIRPIDNQLASNQIKTLVFVLDGVLRNIPMTALYDGNQYLIEKYSVALTPGLQLLEPRSLKQVPLFSLTAGLTEARQGFLPLPAVKQEVKEISDDLPSEILLNETFTHAKIEKELKNHSVNILHLATHGQFSSQPKDTFILTWDKRLNANTLSQLLKTREQSNSEPIELLVLSACQTATGDKRAALGLAGLAVRSGARSTIATLWSVNDQSTADTMIKFYRHLRQGDGNRAEALRQAQLSLLKQEAYQHPYYWAPFVLVGNWL